VPSIIDHNGVVRNLSLQQPSEADLQLRASRPTAEQFLQAHGIEVIPESKWEDVDVDFGPEFFNDQQSSSGCVGWSAAGAEMRMRAMRGMPFEDLSGAFIYAHINGGQDAGASITSSMDAGTKYGYCLRSLFDLPHIYYNQVSEAAKQDAKTRQSDLCIPIDTLEQMYTFIKYRFPVQYGVFVGSNFNYFSDGVAGYTNARYANHSVVGCRWKRINGAWCPGLDNSWGKWGPGRAGFCHVDRRAVKLGDAYAHVSGEWRN